MFFWTNLWLLGARTFKLYPNMQYVTFPAPATWRCGHCQILQLNCVQEVTMREKFDCDWTMYLWEASLPRRPVAKTQFSTAQVNFYWSKFQFTSKHGSSESTSGLFEQQTKNAFCICLQDDCCQSQGCGEQAGGLWLLSHSSVQCTLLGPNFLLRSFNTTYSLCKSGHKCFYTIQPGLQNLSPSSQWWEQEMIGWCPHILYPNVTSSRMKVRNGIYLPEINTKIFLFVRTVGMHH